MKDIIPILKALENLEIEQCVLATVMKVEGSSYRGPGAKMLIAPDGKWFGAISGGCLEGDALRKAREVMISQQPRVEYYDTFEEDNNSIGYVLGCNGRIHVLLEPMTIALHDFFMQMSGKDRYMMATIFEGKNMGKRLLFHEHKLISSNLTDQTITNQIKSKADSVLANDLSLAIELGDQEVFFDIIKPTIRLLIFGAGHDVKPIVQYAKSIHWKVEIYDECIAHLAPVHFPEADKLQMCQREFVSRDIVTNEHTAILLMSHNLHYDTEVMRQIAKDTFFYVGAIGPKKRAIRIRETLKEEGIWWEELENKFHAPVGLDIGANTPQEIAISIVSEIMAVKNKRSGGLLKNRKAPIHQRLADSEQVVST
jgi:xanthine dehydrogenase accessory factor